ncbi:MAG: hypothetical protein QOF06_1098 [Solirubrobacterales bacterium]|nr:hypothetical protein [Solirubrobacterales bacterium]
MLRGWGFRTFVALLVAVAVVATATAATVQVGGLRLSATGQIVPYKLPRDKPAPISVFIAGHVGTTDGAVPPQLQRMVVKVNRHGTLNTDGVPTCTMKQLHPTSTDQALANCSDALVGSGRFWASVVFPEQRPYPTRGRLLVFNGRQNGKPALFAHIYTTDPFNTSFVIPFAIERIRGGQFGTQLTASFPKALGEWGFVDRIKLTLKKKFRVGGKQRSFFNASCPAPAGSSVTSFQLANATFSFDERKPIAIGIVKNCGVKK